MIIALDVETTWTKINKKAKPSPYNPNNKLVCVTAFWIENDVEYNKIWWINHKEVNCTDEYSKHARVEIQSALQKATLIVGHNLKFDLSWLFELGYTYDGLIWDTMLCEYVLARGQKLGMGLADSLARRNLPVKKDLIRENIDKDINVDSIPVAELEPYALDDTRLVYLLWQKQKSLLELPENTGLRPTIDMSNEYSLCLIDIERAGIKIDFKELYRIKDEYETELNQLKIDLDELTQEVMGHGYINLDSPEDLSTVLYSRKVIDKHIWSDIFNLGSEQRGSVTKKKYQTKMSNTEFVNAVRSNTEIMYRVLPRQCEGCVGKGRIQRIKKDGSIYSKMSECKDCQGRGVIFQRTGTIAGFRVVPRGFRDTTAGGFSTGKAVLEFISSMASGKTKVFVDKLLRYGAISVYLSSFVNGLLNFTYSGFVHPSFMQAITATGRLSSNDISFHNQPRGNSFPIRGTVVSRFQTTDNNAVKYIETTEAQENRQRGINNTERQLLVNETITQQSDENILQQCNSRSERENTKRGVIMSYDFKYLEFTAAIELSSDENGHKKLQDPKFDPHTDTKNVMNAAGDPVDRQGSKSHCFPLSTEILTIDGWRNYNEIEIGDTVINYDQNTNKLVKDVVIDYTEPHKQQIIRLKTKHNWQVDSTPEHKWYGWKRTDHGAAGRKYEKSIVTTNEITTSYKICTSAIYSDGKAIDPNDAARLAWLWTDGSEQKYHSCIIQKKYKEEIRKLFNGYITKESDKGNGCSVFYIKQAEYKKLYERTRINKNDLNEFIIRMDGYSRRCWLHAVCLAEGTQRKNGEWRIAQNSGNLCEAIKLAGFLCGHDIRTTKILMKYNGKQHEQITLRTRPYVTGQRIIKENLGEQNVWCITTNNKTCVIKQGDTITISGNTFKPLYGGVNGTTAQMAYYKAFLQTLYPGIASWHKQLQNEAIRNKIINIPSGREYAFPDARRLYNGESSFKTQIVNYPVQGFATADIAPVFTILYWRLLKKKNLQSKLCLVVHDDATTDVYPDEIEQVKQCYLEAEKALPDEIYRRYNYRLKEVFKGEIKYGYNWREQS